MAYVVTAARPTSTRIALAAQFNGPHAEPSLVTASAHTLTLHQSQQQSLAPFHERLCFGTLTSVTAFRPPGEATDHLLVTTSDCAYFTCTFVDGTFKTGSKGDLSGEGLRRAPTGHLAVSDKNCIILYLHAGQIVVFPIIQASKKRSAEPKAVLGEPFTMRLSESKVISIALLHTSSRHSVLGVLYRDQDTVTQFKSLEVVYKKERELVDWNLSLKDLSPGTNIILPLAQGVAVVGEAGVTLAREGTKQITCALPTPTLFNSSVQIDQNSWVLGDDYGLLYSLRIDPDPQIKKIGRSSIPSVLVKLPTSLYVGSHYGDPQLLSWPDLEMLSFTTNLGPISDLLIRDSEVAGGMGSLVTASGAYKDGAIKIVKYGVGLSDRAELEMPNIRGLWGIQSLGLIVVGFIDAYVVLQVSKDGEIEQLDSGVEELVTVGALGDRLVLVTKHEIRIVKDRLILGQLTLPNIGLAKLVPELDSVLLALEGGVLCIVNIASGVILEKQRRSFGAEISCLECSNGFIVVGFWDSNEITLLDTKMETVTTEHTGEGNVPHSVLLCSLPGIQGTTLLVAMNDGQLLTYTLHQSILSSKKATTLGTRPITLHKFNTSNGESVFAVTDRPTIIYASRGKLSLSAINIPSCTFFTQFRNATLGSDIIVATETGLRIGEVDDIQRLHIRAVPLGELPRRLVALDALCAGLTMRLEVEAITGDETQRSYVRLFDRNTFEILDSRELMESEQCQSIARFLIGGREHIVVGTSFEEGEDGGDENTKGRIVVYGLNEDHTMFEENSLEVPGSVYCIEQINSYLVAGVNSMIRLYELSNMETMELKEISKYRSSTIVLALTTHEPSSTILIGDLMKSSMTLTINPTTRKLEELARDYVPTWMTSVAFLSQTLFLGSEAEGNLVLLSPPTSPLDENQGRMERVGEFRVGQMINKIRAGRVTPLEDYTSTPGIVSPRAMFGTVEGGIGIVGVIESTYIDFLLRLQSKLGLVVPSLGGLTHSGFRGYCTERTRDPEPKRFVDGDLIELFLELGDAERIRVVEGLGKSVDEVAKIVEDLARLH